MGWVISVTPRPRFNPRKRTHGTHCTGGWVGPRAGLDTEARVKILCLCWGSNLDHPVVQSIARHYTDWATPAPIMLRIHSYKNYWCWVECELYNVCSSADGQNKMVYQCRNRMIAYVLYGYINLTVSPDVISTATARWSCKSGPYRLNTRHLRLNNLCRTKIRRFSD
jgi:hypothetical protein